jgi:hypothetical protein
METKLCYIANWYQGIIKERRLLAELPEFGMIFEPVQVGEVGRVEGSDGVCAGFHSYNAAIAWIKERRQMRINKVTHELMRVKELHKAPVRFYELKTQK